MDVPKEKGTWELVQKPSDMPITNKWTFIWKQNKAGKIIYYCARLVTRGFAEWFRLDYTETFPTVIRMDSLHVILALVPMKKLKVQQTYFDGILQETIYMNQPEGYEDGKNWVYKLIKTIYGLKQAGCKWNQQLDTKLQEHGYLHLKSDLCIYVRWDGDNVGIITVWVNDLMLFASANKTMNHMKNKITWEWQFTNLAEKNSRHRSKDFQPAPGK